MKNLQTYQREKLKYLPYGGIKKCTKIQLKAFFQFFRFTQYNSVFRLKCLVKISPTCSYLSLFSRFFWDSFFPSSVLCTTDFFTKITGLRP